MKTDVNEITKLDFRDALEIVWNGKVTTIAPLGFSGDNLYLYNNKTEGKSWSGCVTMRTHSGMPELLIANKAGRWLSFMKVDPLMDFEYVLDEFYRQFENVKHLIDGFHDKENAVEFSADVQYSAGFKLLELAQSANNSTE
jgi:hypothetical protein